MATPHPYVHTYVCCVVMLTVSYCRTDAHTQAQIYIYLYTYMYVVYVHMYIHGVQHDRAHNELLKWFCFLFICCCCNCCNLFYCVKVKAIVKCFIITFILHTQTHMHSNICTDTINAKKFYFCLFAMRK